MRWLIFPLLVGLALRLCLFAAIWANDPDAIVFPDSASYEGPARALLAHGAFWTAEDSFEPEVHRTPGYPALIALVYAVADSRAALMWCQIGLSLVTAVLVGKAAARLGGRRAGLCALWLCCLDPGLITYSTTVLSETLFVALLAGMVLAGTYGGLKSVMCIDFDWIVPRWSFFVIYGILLGVATMVRPVTLYWIIPALVVQLWSYCHTYRSIREKCMMVLAMSSPFLLLIGGWTLRNQAVAGVPVFALNGAQATYLMKASAVETIRSGRDFLEVKEQFYREVAAHSDLPPAERLAWYREASAPYLGDWPALMQSAWTGVGYLFVSSFAPTAVALIEPDEAWASPIGEFLHERAGWWERWMPDRAWIVGLFVVDVGFTRLVYLLALVGVVLAFWRGWSWEHGLIVLLAAYLVAIHVDLSSYSRYRVPLLPIVNLYGGMGLAWLWGAVSPKIGVRWGPLGATKFA